MSGYAESMLRRLRQRPGAMSEIGESSRAPIELSELIHDLEIIRDETFRCKRITQALLDLSRMGDSHRTAVSLWQVIEDVVSLVRNTPGARDRQILVTGEKGDNLIVVGSEHELKQVLINLIINSLQAVPGLKGRVEVHAMRQNGWVEMQVIDNGCGMASGVV